MQSVAAAQPPQILQIYREPLKPDSTAAYNAIEQETARMAAALGCPHPYLAAESLTGTKEVWWFNAYDSAVEQKQVYDAYARNAPLMAALQRNSRQKAALTFSPTEVIAYYRPELSVGEPWVFGRGRFLLVTVTKKGTTARGAVFEASDGTRFIVRSAPTRDEPDVTARPAGTETYLLAVRPLWSFAAKEWIAMDPGLWEPSPPSRE